MAATGGAGIAMGVAGAVEDAKNNQDVSGAEVGHATLDQWNYKANITTIFNAQTGACTKETIYQNCEKPKTDICKKWEDQKTTTQTMQLI